MSSNFELTIKLLEAFNEATARAYFGCLARKIKTQGLTEIIFKETNDFFPSEKLCAANI